MLRILLPFVLILAASAADDPWAKIRELKSGSELRVYKRGATQPLVAKLDQLTDDAVVVALRNEQTAIPKEEIDRIDYRPARTGGLLKQESRTKVDNSRDGERAGPKPNPGPSGPSTSTSSGVTFNPKPDFETVYRRVVRK